MNDSFLKANGTPDVTCLLDTFTRCSPIVPGGIDWLDEIRDCNGPNDSPDGRKHDIAGDPNGKAFPWENASNCKPFVADDVINELAARDLSAFWRSMIQRGAGQSEESGYAVALVEHLVFGPMMAKLDKEVELSTQLRHARGWCLLAPRWRQEFGLKRFEVSAEQLQALVAQAPPESPFSQLLTAILDPLLEEQAMSLLREWYNQYVTAALPEKFRERAPSISDKALRKAVRDLREKGKAATPIPYVCRNEPEIIALEPWREVFIPPELTDAQDVVFQVEYLTEQSLRARIVGEGYDEKWVEEAVKNKQAFGFNQLPVRSQPRGLSGALLGSAAQSTVAAAGVSASEVTGLIEVVYAIYRGLDEDDIPSAWCTVLHRNVSQQYGKHELIETINGDLPYIELAAEWRNRALASSRSVQEMVATQQKLIKDTLDQIIDRGSITILPPVNVYESPTGAKYQFGPAAQNYVRQGREPQFMQMPSGTGLADGVNVHNIIKKTVDNRFGLMSEDVSPSRMQTAQERSVRRFLISWSRAFQQVLALYQKHGDDADFARITGAPTGWLDARRSMPNLLSSIFDFDVRELDSEMFIEQLKAMNTMVLPNDVLGVIERGQYAAWMARGIVGPRVARSFLRTLPDASAALKDKAEAQVLKMFAGNAPSYLDQDDPTAASLLKFSTENVLANPNYVRALSDEALLAVAGQAAPMIAQRIGQRQPNELFSALLVKWIENLKFIGVTQQENKQIGRMGISPNAES